LTKGKLGRLPANEYMQSADYDNVYVVGDLVWHLEGEKVVPQVVENALQTARTAAGNVIADLEDREKKKHASSLTLFSEESWRKCARS